MGIHSRFLAFAMLEIVTGHFLYSQPLRVSAENGQFSDHPTMTVTVASGFPYRGLTEYRFDFSQGYSVGLRAASASGFDEYGLLGRLEMWEPRKPLSLSLMISTTYCSKVHSNDPRSFLLVWPQVEAEWTFISGQRISLGLGAAVASAWGRWATVWNTLHAGFLAPISKNIGFEYKISRSVGGLNPANINWVLGPATMMTLCLSYQLD